MTIEADEIYDRLRKIKDHYEDQVYIHIGINNTIDGKGFEKEYIPEIGTVAKISIHMKYRGYYSNHYSIEYLTEIIRNESNMNRFITKIQETVQLYLVEIEQEKEEREKEKEKKQEKRGFLCRLFGVR